MRNIKIKRFISYVLILAIAISTFNVTGEGYIAKAEENENVEDTSVAEQELTEEAVTEEENVEISDVENSGITEYSEVNNTQESDTDYEQIQETEAVQESGVEEDIQEEVKTDEAQENTPETEREYAGDGYTVKFVLDNQWESGFNATVTIITIPLTQR